MWRNNRMLKEKWMQGAALLAAVALLAAAPDAALAYVGPGAGLTAIGSVLALLAAIGLALVGFVWYPVKRLLKRKSVATTADDSSTGGSK